MLIQAGPKPPPESEIEAGVIEDARARQRRQRHAGAVLVATALVGGAIAFGMLGGGGGAGAGRGAPAGPSGSGPAANPAHLGADRLFAGAPATQPSVADDVEPAVCPLAHRSRYLPRWSGCVSARIADLSGDGSRELVLIYSHLRHTHLEGTFAGEPERMKRGYPARQAMLRVVRSDGESTTTRIAGTKAAALLSIARVGEGRSEEIFIFTGGISSGSYAAAYGLYHGRLVPAGVTLDYGGDSGEAAGFDCLPGRPPRVIQRHFLFDGTPDNFDKQLETNVIYVWHGPRLVRAARHRFSHEGLLTSADSRVGVGCLRGISRR